VNAHCFLRVRNRSTLALWIRADRRTYLSYIEAGLDQGRRDELIGGGLIRGPGGWSEVKRLRSKGQAHMMDDEWILGAQSLWTPCFPRPTKDMSEDMS